MTAQGCQRGTGYRFEDASDGNAIAATAIIVRCGGVECRAIYGGTAVRQGSRALLRMEETDFVNLLDAMEAEVFINSIENEDRHYLRIEPEIDMQSVLKAALAE